MLKFINNVEVNCLTEVISDGRALRIDTIRDVDVRYAKMQISYKIYYKNKEGSCVSNEMHVDYRMVKKNAEYDMCEILWWRLLDNIKMRKSDMYPFQYGSLIVCLVLYFVNALPGVENVAWISDMTIGLQIKGQMDWMIAQKCVKISLRSSNVS